MPMMCLSKMPANIWGVTAARGRGPAIGLNLGPASLGCDVRDLQAIKKYNDAYVSMWY